jgi:hypothetical protein
MARVVILLQNKVLALPQPLANHGLKDRIPIALQGHLAVVVPTVIPYKWRLKVVSNGCPTVYTFEVFFGGSSALNKAVRAIALPRPSDDIDSALGTPAKMAFVGESNVSLIFLFWVFF